MPRTPRLVRTAPIALAVVLCWSCSSGSGSSGAAPTAGSTYPSSIVAIGHSGLTGYDSDPRPAGDRRAGQLLGHGHQPRRRQRLPADPRAQPRGRGPRRQLRDRRLRGRQPRRPGEAGGRGDADAGARDHPVHRQRHPVRRLRPAELRPLPPEADRCHGRAHPDLPNADVFFVSQWADVKDVRPRRRCRSIPPTSPAPAPATRSTSRPASSTRSTRRTCSTWSTTTGRSSPPCARSTRPAAPTRE